ncbi:SGNH/GDSL hydrolase family protein [Rhodococcus sp. IEGM 1374]|uniref:SGNH/GDSL hydrolase family protein n=1 Tax=Rhodococcus sp. IEGM 1374 TaxID=3082221 RepID=UPI002952D0FF|nr:SGNH/GDSL hydrolase family protein [Rhodococcus sp. IEGM 1374]MDV7991223.1 SGNH/GDSL hydrolase family protein [Rhodococcus sp. IEGM 1374]
MKLGPSRRLAAVAGLAVLLVVIVMFAGLSAVGRDGGSDYVSSYTPPPTEAATQLPVAAFLGDSYTAGANAEGAENRYAVRVCRAMTFRCTINGQAETGYISDGSGQRGEKRFVDRIFDLQRDGLPSLIVVQGGMNDPGSGVELRIAAVGTYQQIRAMYPDSRVLVFGPVAAPGLSLNDVIAKRDSLKTAAAEVGVEFVDPIGNGWFTDLSLFAKDGVNLNRRGHQELATRLTASLQ